MKVAVIERIGTKTNGNGHADYHGLGRHGGTSKPVLAKPKPMPQPPIATMLRAARRLITNPRHWTQRFLRREIGDYQAYCAVGAIIASGGGKFPREMESNGMRSLNPRGRAAARVLHEVVGHFVIAEWNDQHQHSVVLAGFDKAIRLAAKRGI